jgi:hypothetical protein
MLLSAIAAASLEEMISTTLLITATSGDSAYNLNTSILCPPHNCPPRRGGREVGLSRGHAPAETQASVNSVSYEDEDRHHPVQAELYLKHR